MKAKKIPGNGLEREELKKVVPLIAPFTVNIVTSTVCNFKCNYCVHSLSTAEKSKLDFQPALMDWAIFEEAVDQIGKLKKLPKVIFLYGVGEPLCNPDIAKMIGYIKEKCVGVKVAFISNGTLLTEENITAMISAGLDSIRISIQGLDEQKYYDTCKARIDYDKFLKTINFLYDNRKQCEVYIKIMDTVLEEGDEEKFYNTYGEMADKIFVERCMPVFEGVQYDQDIKDRIKVDRYGNEHKAREVCPMAFYTLSIMPDGEVRPCDNLKNPVKLGNITQKSLDDIWNGTEMKEFWKMQLRKERYQNEVCRYCIAPDDVAQKSDELDDSAEDVLRRI